MNVNGITSYYMDQYAHAVDAIPLHDALGLLGVVFYIGSYAALQLGRLDGNSLSYAILNGIAASLVLVSLFKDFNLASALIQIVWINVSIVGIYRHFKRRSTQPVANSQLRNLRVR
ncbi:MAG: cyclic nucleotide-binding protein [Pseudomonadota bacterium]